MCSKAYWLYAYNIGAWDFYCQYNSVLSINIPSWARNYDFWYYVSFEALK